MHRTEQRAREQVGEVLDHALGYHARGWSIIPITAGTKKPSCRWKSYQSKRPDQARLKRWFANGDRGLAVILGEVSGGLVCRDFDTMQSYRTWSKAQPALAVLLPTVATARGRHVYFRSDHRGIRHLGDGELRGAGYCLLPPSRHPDGPTYKWLVPLPDGELPLIRDLHAAGLAPESSDPCNREHRDHGEHRDHRGRQKTTEDDRGNKNATVLEKSKDPHQSTAGEADVERVISDTLPQGLGRRHRQVFELARGLKSIPRLADAAVDDLESYVRRWHTVGRERELIGTEPFEETWIDFLRAWPKVRFPRGTEPMTAIFERVKTRPLPPAAERYEQEGLRLLVALCRELQQVSGDKPFFLACRSAGKLLGVAHMTASRWLFLLAHDGIVEEVEKGDRARRRASRYRYRAG